MNGNRKSAKRLWIGLIAAVIVCGGGSWYYVAYAKTGKAVKQEDIVYVVKKGNIRSSITGTSQLEAKDMQLITGVDNALVKSIKLNRNMEVKEGDVLVELSSPTLENSLQKAQVQLSQMAKDVSDTQEQIDALQTKAPISGKLTYATGMDVGSTLNKSTRIATISDTQHLNVTLPFTVEDAASLAVGDSIDLTFDGFLLTKTGTVESISKDPLPDQKGGKLINVQISIENDFSLDAGYKAKGSVTKGGRTFTSQGSGALEYAKVVNVLAGVPGAIDRFVAKDGTYVHEGDLIDEISNDTIHDDLASKQNSYENQKLSVQDLQDRVDALEVKAPFDGVFSTDFVNKKTNVLTTMTPGTRVNAQTQFGGVADTKTMDLDIQVDELDMPNVKAGMKAIVSVDSLQGRAFDAEVGQVSTVGTTTNGVTFYDVVMTVKNNGNALKYGMTATAEILLQDKQNIIKIPIEALQSKGGKRYVTLKKDDGTLETNHEIKIGVRSKTELEVTDGLKEGDKVVIPQLAKQQKMTQQQLDKLRQQFQGGGGPGGVQLSPEEIQNLRQQFQGGGGGGGGGRSFGGGGGGGGGGSRQGQ